MIRHDSLFAEQNPPFNMFSDVVSSSGIYLRDGILHFIFVTERLERPLALEYYFTVGGSILDITFFFQFFFLSFYESMIFCLFIYEFSLQYNV